MSEMRESPLDGPASSKWWMPIGVLVALVPVLALVSLALPPDAFTSILLGPLTLAGFVLVVLSPVFVYYDRRYLETTSEWKPSWWYYLIPLPLVGYVLSIAYLYQRHRHLGVP